MQVSARGTEDKQELHFAFSWLSDSLFDFFLGGEFSSNMAVRFRSHSLDNKELQALYGEGREHYLSRDEDGTSEVRI